MNAEAKQTAALIWVLFWIVVIIAGVVGWVLNLIQLFGMWSQEITTELVIRIIGVPIPIIGAIAGWF